MIEWKLDDETNDLKKWSDKDFSYLNGLIDGNLYDTIEIYTEKIVLTSRFATITRYIKVLNDAD
jgi:hypothetical protein